MLAGEMYNAADPQLADERRRARDLCKSLNDSHDNELELRSQILQNLFGSAGADVWIEPPFYCDYGSNIFLGNKVYFNLNCIILDPAAVIIGSNHQGNVSGECAVSMVLVSSRRMPSIIVQTSCIVVMGTPARPTLPSAQGWSESS